MRRINIQPKPIKRLKLTSKIMSDRNDDYPYLRFFRKKETISRVDRYSIMLFWKDYDAKGNLLTMQEMFFYPSDPGMDEINGYAQQKKEGKAIVTKKADFLMHRLNQLIEFGNPYWRQDVNYVLTKENWLLSEPQISTFQDHQVQNNNSNGNGSKSRLQLQVKGTENKLKKHTLSSKPTKTKLNLKTL